MFDFESILEKSGDIYISIVEEQQDYSKSEKTYINKIILENKKIERPEQNALTKRIYAIYLNNTQEDNKIFVTEPHSNERKLNVYVGKVTDVSILSSIKNKESEFVTELQRKFETELRREKFTCPKCGGKLIIINGQYGKFLGCSNYSKTGCNYTKKINKNI